LYEQALADLRSILADLPGTPAAVEASLLSAEALELSGKIDDALAAHVEFEKRFPGHVRVPESRFSRARLMALTAARQERARQLFGEIAAEYPGTPLAKRALNGKLKLENLQGRRNELDPVLNAEGPPMMATWRTFAEQFPDDIESAGPLNQLARVYHDNDRWALEAEALEKLSQPQFGPNAFDVWFRLAETYERRLKEPLKARDAYLRVPKESPRFQEAQRRARNLAK
jgi:tetratricopeptide (TPR) repeat protein